MAGARGHLMLGKPFRTLMLSASVLAAACSAAMLTNCSAPADEEDDGDVSEDAVTGVNNSLGLALIYDNETKKVRATLKEPLGANDQLFLRVRRGTIGQDSQAKLNCSELAAAPPASKSNTSRAGAKTLYEGPSVSNELLGLIGIYNDPRWYGGRETPQMKAEIAKGPDPIVEACIMRGTKVRARLLTNLAYAWDRGNELTKQTGGSLSGQSLGNGIHFAAGDAGTSSGGTGGATGNAPITDEQATVIVAFVNDPATTIEILDDKVGLDRRAAKNVINHRNGPDGRYPSADDDKYDNLAELDAITYIGTATLKKIRDYAVTHGGGTPDTPPQPQLREGERYSTIDYANLCTQTLGEIPFFKKLANGKYDSFDCRDFVGSDAEGHPTGRIEGVEGTAIPLSVNDVPQTECTGGRTSSTYDCVDKCDRGMWLTASSHTGLGQKAACQPGVTVTTAKNDKGTHWILLCRKVDNTNGQSMMKTKTFNDIAIIGNNPATGNTCFFQNKENVGNDGSRVTHPADVERSSAIWPSEPSSYCTKNCHTADAFVHSPWIDEAKRSNGQPIVPKIGQHPDFPISRLDRPYRLINGPSQGFGTSPQMVSEEVAVCTTCHRVAGAAFAEFSNWATGSGDAYYSKITDPYKAFAKSHWMPPRLDDITEANWEQTAWAKAVKHIQTCTDDPNATGCEFFTVPER